MQYEIEIRPAVQADAPALSDLVCAVLHRSNLADYGLENIMRVAGHFTPDGVVAMIAKRHETYVALWQGRIVGTASLDLAQDGQTAEVKTFFVDAGMQQKGIGARLYDQVVTKAAESGVSRFTVRSSIAAIPFYQKLGFVSIRDHWDGTERTVEMHN